MNHAGKEIRISNLEQLLNVAQDRKPIRATYIVFLTDLPRPRSHSVDLLNY